MTQLTSIFYTDPFLRQWDQFKMEEGVLVLLNVHPFIFLHFHIFSSVESYRTSKVVCQYNGVLVIRM